PSPPAWQTAMASAGVEGPPAIGAWTIGSPSALRSNVARPLSAHGHGLAGGEVHRLPGRGRLPYRVVPERMAHRHSGRDQLEQCRLGGCPVGTLVVAREQGR